MLSSLSLISLLYLPSLALSEKYLFSFGASYTDTGFDINGTQPSAASPLGNPAYGTFENPANVDTSQATTRGTWSGGPNYIDFITTKYNSSPTYTYNFAYGGAVIHNAPHSLQDQVSSYFSPKYSTPGSPAAPWTSASALFNIFIGIDDINADYKTTSAAIQIPLLLDAYFDHISQLYTFGARNFLLINIPPVDRSAAFAKDSAADNAKRATYINAFNTYLATAINTWQAAHTDAQTSLYDMHAWMEDVLDNAEASGFKDATCSGVGNSACVWWIGNNMHTTSTMQSLQAKNMSAALAKVGW